MYEHGLNNPNFTEPSRRYRILKITPELLFGLLFNPRFRPAVLEPVESCSEHGGVIANIMTRPAVLEAVAVEGLPDDIQVQAMVYDPMQRLVMMRLWSASWEEVELCKTIPEVEVTCRLKRVAVNVGVDQATQPSMNGYSVLTTAAKWLDVQEDIDKIRWERFKDLSKPVEKDGVVVDTADEPIMKG